MTDDDNVLRPHGAPAPKVKLSPEARAMVMRDFGVTAEEADAEMERQTAAHAPLEGESAKAFVLRTAREIVNEMHPNLSRPQRRRMVREMAQGILKGVKPK